MYHVLNNKLCVGLFHPHIEYTIHIEWVYKMRYNRFHISLSLTKIAHNWQTILASFHRRLSSAAKSSITSSECKRYLLHCHWRRICPKLLSRYRVTEPLSNVFLFTALFYIHAIIWYFSVWPINQLIVRYYLQCNNILDRVLGRKNCRPYTVTHTL